MKETTYKSYKEYSLDIEDASFTFFTDTGAISDSDSLENAPHIHEFCEFFYVTKGEIEIQTENSVCHLKENDAALISGRTLHMSHTTDNSQRIVISFAHSKNKHRAKKPYYNKFDFIYENNITKYENFAGGDAFRRFARYYYGTYAEKHQLIISCLHEIIILAKEYASENTNSKEMTLPDSILYRNYIIENYISSNFSDASLSQLSQMLHLSCRQTHRIIKKMYGKSFSDKITEEKMKNAALLISDTNLSFSDISSKLGYKCVHSFFAAFKKYYNTTPGYMRKNN